MKNEKTTKSQFIKNMNSRMRGSNWDENLITPMSYYILKNENDIYYQCNNLTSDSEGIYNEETFICYSKKLREEIELDVEFFMDDFDGTVNERFITLTIKNMEDVFESMDKFIDDEQAFEEESIKMNLKIDKLMSSINENTED